MRRAEHRQKLLEEVHRVQKEIDCLDYLVYQMKSGVLQSFIHLQKSSRSFRENPVIQKLSYLSQSLTYEASLI